MAQTKETKPLFVYWGGVEFGELDDGTEKATVDWYSQEAMDTYHPVPKYPSGRSSSKLGHEEVLESLRELGELDQFSAVTLTVEKGNANKHPKAKEPFYWNLVAIEVGHDSEYWPDGGPEEAEEAEVPAPKIVKQAPADDRDEFADYINKESGDHGQNKGQSQPNVPNPAAIGACANHAADFIVAGLMPKPADVDILDWLRDCRDVIYSQVNQAPPANLRWCSTHGNVYRQDSKQRWYHKMGPNFCVEGKGVLDTDGKVVA
jgi:hypothetical protein